MGGTAGAIFGPWLAGRLADPLGTPALLLIAAGFLLLGLAPARLLGRMAPHQGGVAAAPARPSTGDRGRIGGSAWAGFRAVAQSRYLSAIAG